MVLQLDRFRRRTFDQPAAGLVRDFDVVVNQHPVVTDGNPGIGTFPTIRGKPRGLERDVVRLPGQRRKGHVEVGLPRPVERRALVELTLQSERIEDLHFVAALNVDTTVATGLPPRIGHVRRPEFEVQREILEPPQRFRPNGQTAFGGELCVE